MRLFSSFGRIVNGRTRPRARLAVRHLDLNTMVAYIPLIGIADERWNLSAARNGRIT